MFLFCLVFAMFCARLFICASWSPAGKGLTSWLSFVVSSVSLSLSHWYPGSGVVLDCIDSWSLQPYLFWQIWNLRMVKFDQFGSLRSVLKFSHFYVFNVWRIGAFSSYLWRSGTIFLRCEEMVPNFHKCEELVLYLHMYQWHILNE